MLKCKRATLTTDGGVNTVWEDSKDETSEWEIIIKPENAETFIDYYRLAKWGKEIKKDED